MTEKTFRRLAAEACERHKNDPVHMKPLSASDNFWRDWAGWMKKRATMGTGQSLSYLGKNDPTANKAIANAGRSVLK